MVFEESVVLTKPFGEVLAAVKAPSWSDATGPVECPHCGVRNQVQKPSSLGRPPHRARPSRGRCLAQMVG